jgi:general secretion pathway protein D
MVLLAGGTVGLAQPAEPTTPPVAGSGAGDGAGPGAGVEPAGDEPEVAPAKAPAKAEAQPRVDALGRRISDTPMTVLAFPRATVEQVIPFIVESTGKVVIPQQEVLARRITVINDKPIARQQALDLVFFALQQTGVAVIENPDFILLRDQADIDRQPVPVIGPGTTTLERTDLGSIVQKVFALKHASAPNVAEIVKTSLPDTNNKIIADADSSQVIVTAPVAILQRIERTITALDKPPPDLPKSESFKLRYADAETVAGFIRDLYSDAPSTRRTGGAQGGGGGGNQGGGGGGGAQGGGAGGRLAQLRQGGGGGGGAIAGGAGANAEGGSGARAQATPVSSLLRVTANTQQNAVTVLAETNILAAIRRQIEEEWDKPLPEEAVTPRVYDLKNSDPIKVKAVLEGLFGSGTTGGGARQTVGRLAGQFTFQAVPEAARLVVVGKSPDNLEVIDRIIKDLDQPLAAGIPDVIELKHVQAEDLAEQLNALLAQEGTFAQIRRSSQELSDNNSSASPFASGGNQQFDTNTFARDTPTDVLTFWWQRARPPSDNFGASNMVAKARIVPIAKQNAIMVLAPQEYRAAVAKLIEQLDRPGRQVLIACVIAEVSSEDALSLGLRMSNTAITPTNADNAIGIGPSGNNPNTITGQKEGLINDWFDTSVLNVGVNVNALLQALGQDTTIKILSEPRIFTGDNQEATFFDGQDIPFITDSERNNSGNLVQSFDYRAVGLQLRVRPRITPQRDVDLRVNLELASIQPQQTLFGGFIVDRRETTTQLIIRDGQTVVISGIMRTEDSDITRKVPLLGDIPGLGALFTSTERAKTNTELVAFITPLVVTGSGELDRLNQGARENLQKIRGELPADDRGLLQRVEEAGPAGSTQSPTPTPAPTPAP